MPDGGLAAEEPAVRSVRLRAPQDGGERRQLLADINERLARMSALERLEWSLEELPGAHVLSSSFGAQAAVSLHMATAVAPGLPVVLVDTGYLFPETYRFVDQLAETLALNLRVYRAERSPAWQEARHGQRWQQGLEGLEAYNRENKVEPMNRALDDLGAGTWFAGVRRSQSELRRRLDFVELRGPRFKVHPILDWSDRDIHRYLKRHGLSYHPLWEKGYISIGDMHSTRSVHEVEDASQLRFFGLKRECGLHDYEI